MAASHKSGHNKGSRRSDGLTEPSSTATDWLEDNSEGQTDGSEEWEGRKGGWTAEEDRELSRLIEVTPHISVPIL